MLIVFRCLSTSKSTYRTAGLRTGVLRGTYHRGVSQRWCPTAPPSAPPTPLGGCVDCRDTRTRRANRGSQNLQPLAAFTWRSHSAACSCDTPLRRAIGAELEGLHAHAARGSCCLSRGCGSPTARRGLFGGRVWARSCNRSRSEPSHRCSTRLRWISSGEPPWFFCERVPSAELGAWEADEHPGAGRDRHQGAPALVNAGLVKSVGDALASFPEISRI